MNRTSQTAQSPSYLAASVLLIVLLMNPLQAQTGTGQTDGPQAQLTDIKATALFARDEEGLLQVVEVTVANGNKPREMSLTVEVGSFTRLVTLGVERNQRYRVHIQVPEVKQPTSARFVLKAGDRVLDTRSADLRPRKHWTIYFVPITHHDLGYTDTIENVLNLYAGFYDDVLRFCDETNDWPEEAQYRYTLEGTWSLQHFVAQSAQGGRGQARRLRQAGPDRDRGAVRQRDRQSLRARGVDSPDVPVVSLQASVRRRDLRRLDHRPARPELGPADGAGRGGREVLLRGPADVFRVGPQRHSHVLGRSGDPASRPAGRLPLAGAGRAERARLLPGQLRLLQPRDRAGLLRGGHGEPARHARRDGEARARRST